MHPRIYAEIERTVAQRVRQPFTGRVLEVGAASNPAQSLLGMPALAGAERVGINLDGGGDFDGYRIVAGNANDMPQFDDGSFDLVLCNAVLEHDERFWLTLSEMRRVLAPGGVLIVGVPGYMNTRKPVGARLRRLTTRYLGRMDWLVNSTLTFRIHGQPWDFYRFTPPAMERVLLDGLVDARWRNVMVPPRLIGSGVKPGP